jgi:hypothetical protein
MWTTFSLIVLHNQLSLIYQKRKKMTTDFDKLQELESKINRAYYKSGNSEYFFESKRGSKYEQKWYELMTKLRGWDTLRYDETSRDLTKQSWIDYCKTKGLHPSYNLGDVCA